MKISPYLFPTPLLCLSSCFFLSYSLSLPHHSPFGSKDSLYSSMRDRDREGGWSDRRRDQFSMCCTRGKVVGGGGTNSVETGDASQDFEEFVVAKVEQPA